MATKHTPTPGLWVHRRVEPTHPKLPATVTIEDASQTRVIAHVMLHDAEDEANARAIREIPVMRELLTDLCSNHPDVRALLRRIEGR